MGVALWIIGGAIAVYIAVCVRRGRIISRFYDDFDRDENPKEFWVVVGVWGLILVGFVWTALYFTLPEPGPW